MMDKMDLVFKLAKEKAIAKSSEPGNTATPWKDFNMGWLKYGLAQEFREWEKAWNINELLDIINFAVFIYLAKQRANLILRAEKDAAKLKNLSDKLLERIRGTADKKLTADEEIWRGLETLYGELIRPLLETEILRIIDGLDTDFDFTALPRLFETLIEMGGGSR